MRIFYFTTVYKEVNKKGGDNVSENEIQKKDSAAILAFENDTKCIEYLEKIGKDVEIKKNQILSMNENDSAYLMDLENLMDEICNIIPDDCFSLDLIKNKNCILNEKRVIAKLLKECEIWMDTISEISGMSINKNSNMWTKMFSNDIDSIFRNKGTQVNNLVADSKALRIKMLSSWFFCLEVLHRSTKDKQYKILIKDLKSSLNILPKEEMSSIKKIINGKIKSYKKENPYNIIEKELFPVMDESTKLMENSLSIVQNMKSDLVSNIKKHYVPSMKIFLIDKTIKKITDLIRNNHNTIMSSFDFSAQPILDTINMKSQNIKMNFVLANQLITISNQANQSDQTFFNSLNDTEMKLQVFIKNSKNMINSLENNSKLNAVATSVSGVMSVLYSNKNFINEYVDWWKNDEIGKVSVVIGGFKNKLSFLS